MRRYLLLIGLVAMLAVAFATTSQAVEIIETPNLVLNGDFSNGTSYWSLREGSWQLRYNNWLRLYPSNTYVRQAISVGGVGDILQPGDYVSASCVARRWSPASGPGQSAAIRLQARNAAGGYMGPAATIGYEVDFAVYTGWTFYHTANLLIPEGAAVLWVELHQRSSSAAVEFDNVSVVGLIADASEEDALNDALTADLAAANATITGLTTDLATCTGDLATCTGGLGICENALIGANNQIAGLQAAVAFGAACIDSISADAAALCLAVVPPNPADPLSQCSLQFVGKELKIKAKKDGSLKVKCKLADDDDDDDDDDE